MITAVQDGKTTYVYDPEYFHILGSPVFLTTTDPEMAQHFINCVKNDSVRLFKFKNKGRR